MTKRILFLTFYFEPDLCAGSFRNSPLAYELARAAKARNIEVDVVTTIPNRYSTYNINAPNEEVHDNLTIRRIALPPHSSGIKDQINSFRAFFTGAKKLVKGKKYDLVYASSSRLFSAYLGYTIAKKQKIPLYLDIRDIFSDTVKDVFANPFLKVLLLPGIEFIEKKTFNYASHINLISGGFKDYFLKFKTRQFSTFSNGIDPEFVDASKIRVRRENSIKTILYAGNIGEGQALHKIIPEAAKNLGPNYSFRIIGDGGAKKKLIKSLVGIENVELLPPVPRLQLIDEYNQADFLFIHLNNYDAFKKVLPSKVFELGVFPVPLIAGVDGYSKSFIEKNLPGSILIEPCNPKELVTEILNYQPGETIDRRSFVEEFSRSNINKGLANSILSFI